MSRRILVICNLQHASPRLPGLLDPLIDNDWEIHIVCPELPTNSSIELGFPLEFEKRVQLHTTGKNVDALEKVRLFLRKIGFSDQKSMLEQVKSASDKQEFRNIVSKVFNLGMTFLAFPDLERKWKRNALNKCNELINKYSFDIILSSSPFPTSHVVAANVCKISRIKWVADYRDPWCLNPVYPYGVFRKAVETNFEKWVLKSATILTTVSEPYAQVLRQLHGKEVEVIPNGFIDYSKNAPPVVHFDRKTIVHTGNIYEGNHNLDILFRALRSLLDEGLIFENGIQVLFFGRFEVLIQDRIEMYGLSQIVFQKGHVSRLECIAIQKEADGLLFFNWEEKNRGGLSHLKFYEYLASKTNIFVIGTQENEYTSIIKTIGAGKIFKTDSDLAIGIIAVGESIASSYTESALSQFSYAYQSSKLEKILCRLL